MRKVEVSPGLTKYVTIQLNFTNQSQNYPTVIRLDAHCFFTSQHNTSSDSGRRSNLFNEPAFLSGREQSGCASQLLFTFSPDNFFTYCKMCLQGIIKLPNSQLFHGLLTLKRTLKFFPPVLTVSNPLSFFSSFSLPNSFDIQMCFWCSLSTYLWCAVCPGLTVSVLCCFTSL